MRISTVLNTTRFRNRLYQQSLASSLSNNPANRSLFHQFSFQTETQSRSFNSLLPAFAVKNRLVGGYVSMFDISRRNFLAANKYKARKTEMTAFARKEDAAKYVDDLVKNNRIVIFSKTYCSFCEKAKNIFTELKETYKSIELDTMDPSDMELLKEVLHQRTKMTTFPNVFINGRHVGGSAEVAKLHASHKLTPLLLQKHFHTSSPTHGKVSGSDNQNYDFDLIVIGGGSGGLAASKEAARLGAKVALLDFVKPSPQGTTWGAGGTCVNVGCIPKKMMHLAGLVGETIEDAPSFGWNVTKNGPHDWNELVSKVQNLVKASNWGYRVTLQEADVTYLNEFGEFVDNHTVQTVNRKGKSTKRTANHIIIAVGGRPRYPDVDGAKEYAITSDDIFSLRYHPGKTLVVGASYIALETAGFLRELGIDTTVMVRSILLRGFDKQMAGLIGSYLEDPVKVKFQKGRVPVSIKQISDGEPPKLLVKSKGKDGKEHEEEFNTVIFAVGRFPVTKDLRLENIGVKTDPSSGKIIANESDETSVDNVYALGDCVLQRPELTPAAIQAGLLLARRLYGGETTLVDYKNCPTTIFTPLEYGCIGLSEEEAIVKYGEPNIEVYHSYFQSFEAGLPNKDLNKCYVKLICVKSLNELVVGFHYLGPNAGEVTQGFALAIKLGATKSDFNSTIGIHPTSAENFTVILDITKSSDKNPFKRGCCG